MLSIYYPDFMQQFNNKHWLIYIQRERFYLIKIYIGYGYKWANVNYS